MSAVRDMEIAVTGPDGHRWQLLARPPVSPTAVLLWLPALGVAARHYLPFADALARAGIAVVVHEWRGHGSSSLRAGKDCDWGYRHLLSLDLPATEAALEDAFPALPRMLGGHSLGAQLACCRLGLQPDFAEALWVVAGGAPYWRAFPWPTRALLPLAYRFLPWLAARCGALPGRRIGFGGQEARGVIRDWARSALSGRYAAEGLPIDLESAMRGVRLPVTAVVLDDDWLAPRSSLDYLLAKLGPGPRLIHTLEEAAPGIRADHFAWLQQPGAVADALTGRG